MKIRAIPNKNSIHLTGDYRAIYEMIDLVDTNGTMWASVNVDMFHDVTPGADNALAKRLTDGETVLLEFSVVPVTAADPKEL